MDKYKKGKNVEEPFEKTKIPIKNLPEDFLWMHVNPGTKMKNVLEYALEQVKSRRTVVWSGSGPAVGKVISCVEIMKRQHPEEFHQINKICYRKVKEYWDPLIEDLDPLVVTRELPTIHILLSKDPLDTSEPGYQPPASKRQSTDSKKNSSSKPYKPPRRQIDSETFESFGLRSARTKGPRRVQRGGFNTTQDGRAETAASSQTQSERRPQKKKPYRPKPASAGPSGVG